MRTFIIVTITIFLLACNHKAAFNNNKPTNTIKTTTKTIGKIDGDTIESDKEIIENDTVNGDTIKLLSKREVDTTQNARFIQSGECVDKSITPEDSKYNWRGLFEHKGLYYLADTKVTVTLDKESISDENPDGDYIVKTDNKDDEILLVTRLSYLIDNGPVNFLKIPAMLEIIPGKPYTFNFNGNTYKLYATGHIPAGHSIDFILNYNLYIEGNAKGHYFKQLLVHNDFYESGFVTYINFIGDLDGDGLPDFIINTSNYGLGSADDLFLSKPAGPKRLFVDVGGYATAD
ncbi:hypothetical protein [Mucilaginibacter sp.]